MSLYKVEEIFYKLRESAILPQYQHEDDSGMDMYACLDEPIIVEFRSTVIVPTGITCILPPSTELQIRSRSGLAAENGIFVLNSPGTIDEGYRQTAEKQAEIKIILANFSNTSFVVNPGMRIAQAVFAPVLRLVQSYYPKKRAGSGIGSTGV